MVENIYVFIGEMGSGKSTIVEALSKELNIPIVKTTTSRPIRDNLYATDEVNLER